VALVPEIEAMAAELAAWRRRIHAHPELGFEEHQTSDFVAGKLAEFGVEVHRGVGGTGVVGVLRVGNETRAVGLRADMDALPIQEASSCAHPSRRPGVMHACGHDGHTVMLLAAARYLARSRGFRGQVNFIFQPAEEGLGGARAMLADGLLDRFPCDSLYALHIAPGVPLGSFGASPGLRTAAGAFFDVEVQGKGAHGAFPDQGLDPVVVAAELVLALQTIVARRLRPAETAVLSVTQVHAGDAYNVIPATARLAGTVRCFSLDTMRQMEDRMRALVEGIARAHGAAAHLDFRIIFHPVVNAAAPSALAADVCEVLVGPGAVLRGASRPGTGSEDFAFMAERVPACYVTLGNGEHSAPLHNPGFDFDDAALVHGASFFARVVEASLPC
jgi:hippurate hydrolase